ncbi:MAG: type IV toxin-antitoxin system AbiEi family antitoxin domain-containing protein [Acidimicrobiia bacterium]
MRMEELSRLAARQHGVFTVEHARLLDMEAKALDRLAAMGAVQRVHHGVLRFRAVPPTWKGDLLAACWAGGFRAVASHRSAAALWGLKGGRRHVVEITCPRWRRAQHDGLVVHENNALDPADLTVVDGIPVTKPELTLLGIAAVCSPSVLEIALDRAESVGLVTPTSVRGLVKRMARPGRPGIRALRSLLDSRSPEGGIPASERETMLRQGLRAHGLPEPVIQHEIQHGGVFIGRVDAAYPEARIAIEYDSYDFHGGRLALVKDSERRTKLLAAGWHPFTATDVELKAGCRLLGSAIAALLYASASENPP